MRKNGGVYSKEAFSRGSAFIRSNTVINRLIQDEYTNSECVLTYFTYRNASIKRPPPPPPLLLNGPPEGRLLETYFFPCIICWTVFGSNY